MMVYAITGTDPRRSPILLYQLLLVQDRWSCASNILFLSARSPILSYNYRDYIPDRAQKLISSSMSRYLSTRNISPKSMHAFLTNLDNRQTDRRTNERGETHLPPPLSEVIIIKLLKWICRITIFWTRNVDYWPLKCASKSGTLWWGWDNISTN